MRKTKGGAGFLGGGQKAVFRICKVQDSMPKYLLVSRLWDLSLEFMKEVLAGDVSSRMVSI